MEKTMGVKTRYKRLTLILLNLTSFILSFIHVEETSLAEPCSR